MQPGLVIVYHDFIFSDYDVEGPGLEGLDDYGMLGVYDDLNPHGSPGSVVSANTLLIHWVRFDKIYLIAELFVMF